MSSKKKPNPVTEIAIFAITFLYAGSYLTKKFKTFHLVNSMQSYI